MGDFGFAAVPSADRWVLRGARVPAVLLGGVEAPARDGLAAVDIVIDAGRVGAVVPAGKGPEELPGFDCRAGIVMPCFVDSHTHIDKGHIWPRAANPNGTFMGALTTTGGDRVARWSEADVERRMDFSLRCAHAHGTAALRTHLDSIPPQDGISWPLFARMRERWAGRIDLQAVALMGGDWLFDKEVVRGVARRAAEHGGLLGGAMASNPRAREALDNLVAAAIEFGIDLDLHLDETQDPASNCLDTLATMVREAGFRGTVTAGHCCSLARQPEAEAERTMARVADAGIHIISLPMCNLYLQARAEAGPVTPAHRGITLIRELRARGVTVACASDNTRDPFYAYGDLDGLEVLREAVRVGHLDHPIDEAPAVVTAAPAAIMGLAERGRIAPGLPADLVLFQGRTWTEWLSRPEARRTVLRAGKPIDRTQPDYRDLDDLMGN